MILTRPMTIDQVCRAAYGDESVYLEAVLAANPGLARLSLVLPAGTDIVLPDVSLPRTRSVVSLWD